VKVSAIDRPSRTSRRGSRRARRKVGVDRTRLAWGSLAAVVACDGILARPMRRQHAAIIDELAHLATGLTLLAGRPRRRFAIGVVAGSLLPDIDHVPDVVGWHGLRRGRPRPITHSLPVFATLVVAARAAGDEELACGLAAGLALHLLRDLATPRGYRAVLLCWPLSQHPTRVPYIAYGASLGIVALRSAMR
jgi:membrane-bound metal-dependent hydrolase YbcI (DUF457 family)